MKRICIIYDQPITQVQGINYVNNSFVVGNKYFREKGYELVDIYSPEGVFECKGQDRLNLVGANVAKPSYQKKRKLKTLLRKVVSSDFVLTAAIKHYFGITRMAKRSIKYFNTAKRQYDYIIFQDTNTAHFYFKYNLKNVNTKTVLILHCDKDPLEQGRPMFKGLFKYKCIDRYLTNRVYKVMDNVDKVVYLSQHAADHSHLSKEHKTFVFNGVDDFTIPQKVEPVHSPIQFVIVGSVTIHKGQHAVIQAVSLIDEEMRNKLHLTIIGGGHEYEMCKKMIEEKGMEKFITMTGPRNDVSDLLKGMDVFVLASKSEGMPMSIIEAMRQGLYIMATHVGGIPDMIDPEFGMFISRDPREIARDIVSLIESEKVTIEAKQAARARYENDFALNRMIDGYVNVFDSL